MGMFDNIKFPFLTHQQLNLDWILNEIKRVMGFFPEEGDPGTVLMKTEDGTAWEELAAVDININGVPEDTELSDTDKLIFYDISASANRKITAPNLLNAMMSNGTPLMDGTGSAGTSKKPARYDHRHPTDTSRQAALSGVQMSAVNSGITAEKVSRLDRINKLDRLDATDNPSSNLHVVGTGATSRITLDNPASDYANLCFILFGGSVAAPNRTEFIIDVANSTSVVVPIATTNGVGWIRIELDTENSTIDFISSSYADVYLGAIFGDHA